jgi:Ras-related protein Rab-6A
MKEENKKKYFAVKIIIVGNQAVGKTNIVTRYVKGEFNKDYMLTISMDYLTYTLQLDEKVFYLRLYDTAGTEQFRSIRKNYYSNSCCALIVYDVTDESSFNSVKQWIEDSQTYGRNDIHLVLVGNKIDLNDQRKISKEDGQNLATQYGMDFYESSALTGENINEIFEGICKFVNNQLDDGKLDLDDPSVGVTITEYEENIKIDKTLTLKEIPVAKKKKKKFC